MKRYYFYTFTVHNEYGRKIGEGQAVASAWFFAINPSSAYTAAREWIEDGFAHKEEYSYFNITSLSRLK